MHRKSVRRMNWCNSGLMFSTEEPYGKRANLFTASEAPSNEQSMALPCKFILRFDGWETALKEEKNGTYAIVPR